MRRARIRPRTRAAALLAFLAVPGCMTVEHSNDRARDLAHASRKARADRDVVPASTTEPEPAPEAVAIAPRAASGTLDAWIRSALEHNPTVRAAKFNVMALKHRLPQVTSLDDPVASNSIFPIPSVAPQYSLMGYMPYSALLAQQFPWCGTLKLRGEAAAEDVRVALFELAAVQLDVVAGVKAAYHDVRFNERALALLKANRKLSEDFLEIAEVRYKTATASQADVLRAEVAVADVDREIEAANRALAEARSELARLLHADPETPLEAGTEPFVETIPEQLDRLVQLATAGRPELQGRLAAVARDGKVVELARKKYYPDVTLGAIYQDMERTNAVTPATAMGMPNVGLFVGFNVPIYHKKLRAGVHEAVARANADAQLYEAERDQAHREVRDALVSAKTQQNVLGLLRRVNLPSARRVFELTRSEYQADKPGVDYLTLLTSWRERLQVELQIAQVEAELGRSLARLERAVGSRLNEQPPSPELLESASPTPAPAPAPEADSPPPTSTSPFREPAP
ncbi:TolC family protein [Paludisphaera mucosa]|uniref:TolC family protein n=1 Tax=Paludisphaera mucosa TaxID=3030827 RepID=A0ABT6FAB8_9BACT|nr:TolC family protein [Paludisphaera mucosa]MDG3004530.1 TolC family protein [Paludisphaera mucosa]